MNEIIIKTKFEIGETAFRFNTSSYKLEEFVIYEIACYKGEKGTKVNYFNSEYTCVQESQLFKSKEAFIESI
jgi:hypothetical protein